MKNAIKSLEGMGYKILAKVKGSSQGPDLHIQKDDVIFRVEVKKASIKKNTIYCHKVEDARQHDDLIAVEFPSGYVLIEPMEHHLKSCAPCGSRHFYGIY